MRGWLWPALFLLLGCMQVLADDPEYVARTLGDTQLAPAPGEGHDPIGIIPAGSNVEVSVCLDEGAYCLVTWNGRSGFAPGNSLAVEGQEGTILDIERAKWERIRDTPRTPLIDDSRWIAAWGDSLTAGGYPEVAEDLFGGTREVENLGVGGQTSTSIAGRMNAVPTLLTIDADTIPAIGNVAVLNRSITPITNQGPASLPGTLCGIAGILSAATTDSGATYQYRFERDEMGEPVACPADSPLAFVTPDTMRNRVAWLWLGRNGAEAGHTIEGDIAAAVASLGHDRYLVGAILTGTMDDAGAVAAIEARNAALAATYGDRFVDLLSILRAAGDGSPEDLDDVAKGYTPRSLRSDGIHLAPRGNEVVAAAFKRATEALGF